MRQVFYSKMRQFYYKMRQLLQNATVITNCDRTMVLSSGKFGKSDVTSNKSISYLRGIFFLSLFYKYFYITDGIFGGT